jgi:hypothetical protein
MLAAVTTGPREGRAMSNDSNRFYINFDTQERVVAKYQVYLTMPAYYDACVEIDATSEEEARQIALATGWMEAKWDFDGGDRYNIEVCRVDCDDPPADAILVQQGYDTTGASIDALFHRTETSSTTVGQRDED